MARELGEFVRGGVGDKAVPGGGVVGEGHMVAGDQLAEGECHRVWGGAGGDPGGERGKASAYRILGRGTAWTAITWADADADGVFRDGRFLGAKPGFWRGSDDQPGDSYAV